MTRLGPGIYDDGEGGLHLDIVELLAASGYADTPANRATLIAAARAAHGNVTVTVAPLVTLTKEWERQRDTDAAWVVWSFEHQAWWGPGRFGYVEDLAAAGRYTKREAIAIEKNANQYLRDGAIHEQALPLADAERDGAPEP